ncbi:MAG: phospholipid carrier-dependent glycosyltransferase [Bacillota bacterium]|nr:phospholipid carrier-dependent glycosyltransferase [Bacillota bacterium]
MINPPDEKKYMTVKDWLLIALLLAVYIPLSLINLGSREVPESYWIPAETGDTFVVDFGREREISKIAFYSGIDDGEYQLEFINELLEHTGDLVFSKGTNYNWHFMDIARLGRYARLTVLKPGGMLNELAFYRKGSIQPLYIEAILDEELNPEGIGSPTDLFDEQNLIPDRPSFMTGMYFDEIYFGRTAFEHLNRLVPYDSVQPPLAKLLISLGIVIFGMNPFGWRIINVLSGIAMIPVIYIFGKRLFGKTECAFLAAFLLTFDFMHFAHTRFATLEGFMVLFILLSYYFMYEFISRDFFTADLRSLYIPLFFSGLFFGLAGASKLNGVYSGLGLAVIFFWALWENRVRFRKARAESAVIGDLGENDHADRLVERFLTNRNRIMVTVVAAFIFFIIVPLVVYILSYIPVMLIPDHGFADVLRYQTHMFNYHRFLEATHPFSSPWYEWPLMLKPIWIYQGKELPAGFISSIVSFGNPAVWWGGFIAFFLVIYDAFKLRDRKLIFVLIAIFSQYIPWVIIPRLTFIYHYFATVPFLIFGLVYVLGEVRKRWAFGKELVIFFAIITLILFVLFYPILSGMIVERAYVETYLRWFPGWVFH